MEEFIGVKQLYTDFQKISKRVQKGESFIVMKHSTPLFRLVPYQKVNQEKRPYTLKDLQKLQFRSGDKDLSKKVDRIVYGV